MKIKFLIPVIILLVTFSCSINSNSDNFVEETEVDLREESAETEIYQWHLTHVTGGTKQVDTNFETDTVIWVFDIVDSSGNGTLEVKNNNTKKDLEDGLDTGTYSISIPKFNSQSFLFIEGTEFAAVITPTTEDLIINQNIFSDNRISSNSDGFVYTFKRRVVAR